MDLQYLESKGYRSSESLETVERSKERKNGCMQLISRLRICIRTSCGVDSQDRLLWDVTRDHQSFWKKEEAPGYRDYSPCLPLTSAFNALGGI